jgi:hypothetical protein
VTTIAQTFNKSDFPAQVPEYRKAILSTINQIKFPTPNSFDSASAPGSPPMTLSQNYSSFGGTGPYRARTPNALIESVTLKNTAAKKQKSKNSPAPVD